MFIISLGTAIPPQRYSQEQCWQALCVSPQFTQLGLRSKAILKKVLLGNSGIESRHLAYHELNEAFELNPDAMNARFSNFAPKLATQAAEMALRRAATASGEIDAVVISTCTGYLCPGLTSYVSERLGLRSNILAFDLVGQGCGAAIPNLQLAEALLASGRCVNILSICVEVCSAAFYLDDDPGVLVSACLFGDGAGAALLSRCPRGNTRRIEWQSGGSLHNPLERECLRFEQRGGMLRNILEKKVPTLAARHAVELLNTTLARTKVKRNEIRAWILHPGGREVLLALRESLNLCEADLQWSAGVLRELGNVSSGSVWFVLEAALAHDAPGGYWWMSSFGAGFSCHGALLKVD